MVRGLHDSPYTYFTSEELHLGEISLECSRAGAAAAALWLTERLVPWTEAGLGASLAAGVGQLNIVVPAIDRPPGSKNCALFAGPSAWPGVPVPANVDTFLVPRSSTLILWL